MKIRPAFCGSAENVLDLGEASTFMESEVLQRSKVNLSFLAVFSVVLIVVVDADEFLE